MTDPQASQPEPFSVRPEPILISTADGRVSDFNASACTLFEGTAGIYGRLIHELLPFVSAPAAVSGEDMTWQGQIKDNTGRTLDLEVSQTNFVHGLLPTSRLYVVHDTSRRAEFNRAAENLIYSAAHDLCGPLTTLRSALEILGSDLGELDVHDLDQLLHASRRATTRLAILVEDWLCAGNIRSGRLRVHPRPTQLTALVNEAIAIVQPIIEGRGQCVERDIPIGDLYVLADKRFVRQAMVNLLENATKYSPEGEVIWIRARRAASHVQIIVEDHGPGIPIEKRDAVFDWFYRLVPDHAVPGAGLGLAIVKEIVEAHGGTIGIEGEIGAGTRLCFSLPAAEGSRPR